MRNLFVLAVLTALSACGVDGPPVRPADDNGLAPAKNATPKPDPGDWISGTASIHTATTL